MTNQQGAPEALRPIARYKIGYHTDEWGVRSSTPGGISDPSGQWVLYEDHLAALASHGQAQAAPQTSPASQGDALDAARYRWLRDEGFTFADVDLGTDSDGDDFVAYRIRFHLPEPAHSKFEDDEWTGPEIDAAIDAAMKAGGTR